MQTNDIKQGMRVYLNSGWEGTMQDNRKGNTRMVEVEGIYTEIGSVYTHDIVGVLDVANAEWVKVEHTPAQLKLKQQLANSGW